MSQSNLLMIPIDESILLPMESLDQHLADASKPSIISPILRNLLLQYGDQTNFELLNYAETLPQEPVELPQEDSISHQEQIVLIQGDIPLPPKNIKLPLGVPPVNYEIHDVALENETQEIPFIKRTSAEKRTIEKTQTIENEIDDAQQKVKTKEPKRSKLSIDKLAENLAMAHSEVKKPVPSTSTAHDIKTEQDTKQSSTSKKQKKSKKRSKRKEISEDHDKGPEKKKSKKDPIDKKSQKTKDPLDKKSQKTKDPLDKKSEKTKNSLDKKSEKTKDPKEEKEQKTSSSEKKKPSKKQKSKKDAPAQIKESTEPIVDAKEQTSNPKRKKSVKRQSSNDNPLKSEEEGNSLTTSPAKRPRGSKVDITDPIYLEPFKYGWTREVVYRSQDKKTSAAKKADTYYYTAEGKKFRTRKEMTEILSTYEHLTIDNFTYLPRPLGINDPTKELVRDSYTSGSKRKALTKKTSSKSRKPSRRKDSSQKGTISSSTSEQNSGIVVPENVEDTSTNNAQLQKESMIDETNDHRAIIEHIAEPILSASHQYDTTAGECGNTIEESNSTDRPKGIAELDKYLDTKETSNQRILPNAVELNSTMQNQSNIQNDNENDKLDEECSSKEINSSIITSNIDHSTEKSEIEPLRNIDLVNHLDKEIISSSYNNIHDETSSDKEYELIDTEEDTREYGDDPTESEYKSESIPEKSLEELNSSFSEKIFISESLKNSQNVEIKGNEEEKLSQMIDPENLTAEKTAHIRSIDSEVEKSEDLNSHEISAPEILSTLDSMKISATSEITDSLQKIDTENLTIEKTSQTNLDHARSIDNELEISNDLKSDQVSTEASSTTSSDTTKVSETDEKTNSLQETDTESLIFEKTLKNNLCRTRNIDSVLEMSNDLKSNEVSSLESSSTSSNSTKEEAAVVVSEKTNSLQNIDADDSTTDNIMSYLELTSTDSTAKVSNDLRKKEVAVVVDEKTSSLQNIDADDSTTDSIMSYLELTSTDSTAKVSNDLKSDKILEPESSLILLDTTKVSAVDEKTNSLHIVDSENSNIEKTSQNNLGHIESTDRELEISSNLKLDEVSIPESTSISPDPTKVSAADEIMNSQEKPVTNFYIFTANNTLPSNPDRTMEIQHDLKSDEISVMDCSSISSDLTKMSAAHEKTSSQEKSDAENSIANTNIQSNIDHVSSIDSGMQNASTEIISFMSCTLSTTQSVTSTDSSTVSSDSVVTTTQSAHSNDFSSVALNSTAWVSESSGDIESVSSSSNRAPKIDPESTNSVETSLASLISTTTTVTKSGTTTSSEILSIPLDSTIPSFQGEDVAEFIIEEIVVSEAQTSKTENIEEQTGIADIKVDSFNDIKMSLGGGIKKVEQGLYNSSELLSTDSSENTYLVNTEGNTFSFTTESFKQSKKLLLNKESSVSQFKEDVNCMKTIAESIKTLSLPSDLTNKQYFLNCPDILTNETMKNQSSSEMKFGNNNLNNVNQASSQEKHFDKVPHVSCSKENVKNDTSDSIQKVKSPSIVISCSENILLGLDNSIVNKKETLISEINESNDLRKMNTDLDQSELLNSSEISDPMNSNTLSVSNREDTVKSSSTVSKNVYQSAEDCSEEFVRSESYEYQNSTTDEVTVNFEHSNDSSDDLDDTVSLSDDTLSGDTSQDNSNEYSNLYESRTTTTYADYLVSNEFSATTDKLEEENEHASDKLRNEEHSDVIQVSPGNSKLYLNDNEINSSYNNVTDSVELHNDLCEFIKLPPKKNLQNRQLVASDEQTESTNDTISSNIVSVITEETSVENDYNNVPNNLSVDKNVQPTCASQTIEEGSLCELTTLPPQQLLENKESSSDRFEDKHSQSISPSSPATVLESLIENNYKCATTNLPDKNLQNLNCDDEANEESNHSFECPSDILVKLNQLLEMSNESEDVNEDVNEIALNKLYRSTNVPSPHSSKFEQEYSKLRDISNSPITPGYSRKFSPMKPAYQTTPSSSSKNKKTKFNYQPRQASPHSMASFCAGYSALKHIFEYLNFEDLLIAMDVCTAWKEIAQRPHLWKTIRIRNSQLTHSLAKILQSYRTEHLLVVEEDSSDWRNFINVLSEIKSLRIIELCPCPAVVFEKIVKNCPQLKIVNALSLKDDSVNVESIQNLRNPEKLHLGGIASMSMEGDLSFLSGFSNLTHLSLRSIKDLGNKNVNVLQSLPELQSLELGECSEFMNTFGSTILVELKNLQRLRLEKVNGPECCEDILTSVSKIEKLTQLELVNIEISVNFLNCLPKCKNIKKLLVIPAYRRRIPFSNNVIIRSTSKLRNLVRFVWGIPEEFVQRSNSLCKRPFDDCISVLKPIPYQRVLDSITPDFANSTSTESEADTVVMKLLPLNILKQLYARVLPNTQTDILKIPAFATCNLSM